MRLSLFVFLGLLLCGVTAQAQKKDSPSSDKYLIDADSLFQDDKVVQIEIEVKDEDWDKIRLQSRNFMESLSKEAIESPFTYVKADIKIDGVEIKNVGIRKKGFFGFSQQRSAIAQSQVQ